MIQGPQTLNCSPGHHETLEYCDVVDDLQSGGTYYPIDFDLHNYSRPVLAWTRRPSGGQQTETTSWTSVTGRVWLCQCFSTLLLFQVASARFKLVILLTRTSKWTRIYPKRRRGHRCVNEVGSSVRPQNLDIIRASSRSGQAFQTYAASLSRVK